MSGKQMEGSSGRNLKEPFTHLFSTVLSCTCYMLGRHVSGAGGTSKSKVEIHQDFKAFAVKSREGGWWVALSFPTG